ncbi:MAG: hypothetical protein M3Q99_17775 [Acidobacteriota bacterium]|nr:hypothetical protein [Acidobacteriota bacterium]
MSDSDLKISIYEFREVFERFAGLTIAYSNTNSKPHKHETEFFRVAAFQNQELSSKCLHRRNQKRLYFHQTEAEKDFFRMIAAISNSLKNSAELEFLTIEFVKLLNNSAAQKALTEIFDSKLQTTRKISVIDLEKDLWMLETLNTPTVKQISMRLQTTEKTAK